MTRDRSVYVETDKDGKFVSLRWKDTGLQLSTEGMHEIAVRVNACASPNVANWELERLLDVLDKIMPDEHTFSTGWTIELWKAKDALRAKAPNETA